MRGRGVSEADVVGAIYAAALESAQSGADKAWGPSLALLRTYLNCPSLQIFQEDLATRRASFAIMDGLDPSMMKSFYEHYLFLDPNYEAKKRRPLGSVTASNFLMPDSDWENLEWYYDFTRPQGIFYQMGALLVQSPGLLAGIGIQRPRSAAPFSASDARRLRRLVPHLQRAFQVARLLAAEAASRSTLQDLLERLPHGAILLNRRGQVVAMNRVAVALVNARDGLTEAPDGLAASHPRDRRLLRELIGQVLSLARGEGVPACDPLRVRRASGRPDLQVLVTPLRVGYGEEVGSGGCQPGALVIVADPEVHPQPSRRALQAWFGLSPAEAQVVCHLVEGLEPVEIAGRLGLSHNTVRAHLRSIFSKMDAPRQSMVIRKVLASPALARDSVQTGRL